ncbi:MAG: YdbL family protein [Nitrospinae bacterium]|nr:YdbL family protein [Nitrospinota bacterium]
MNKKLFLPLLIAFAFIFVSSPGFGDDLKARFLERQSAIASLKDNGIVGESNRGYLEFVGPKRESEGVVNEENADRKKVYENIGQKTGVDSETVGRRRAAQIGQNSPQGHFLQDGQGKWNRK